MARSAVAPIVDAWLPDAPRSILNGFLTQSKRDTNVAVLESRGSFTAGFLVCTWASTADDFGRQAQRLVLRLAVGTYPVA